MVSAGVRVLGKETYQFTVWAPLLDRVALKILSSEEQLLPMKQIEPGYWQVSATNITPGTRYIYQLDGRLERPDPASQFQPEGVRGASEVVDRAFAWHDRDWAGVALEDFIIYEVHVGTFTPEGTFDAIIPRLVRLQELGITALELMPVAQFSGDRNWGYDGVYPYAVQNSYGGPQGLKRLVDACHQQGIAVVLDVVYNHLGPEGNYLTDFAPYLTSKYSCLWGEALNFDGAYSDGVRNFFIENALYWLETFHIDALRLDAIQGIYDLGAKHFLAELAERVEILSQQMGRKLYVTAESDLNDTRVIRPRAVGGYGLDAQWCDDFHHALHTLLTGESQDYYQDFGHCKDLEKSLREGFVYSGQYAPARKRSHGNSSIAEPAHQFIVCAQNHDQVGNRLFGDRLPQLVSFEGLKLAAGTVLLSPYLPLLFMGEEYGEKSPFFYFISHSDPNLVRAVKTAKEDEFKAAGFAGDAYDPAAVETFAKSKVDWDAQYEGKHAVLWQFYQHLIRLRRTHPALKKLDKTCLQVSSNEAEKLIFLHRTSAARQVFYLLNFNDRPATSDVALPPAAWQKILDTADLCWNGPGSSLPETLQPFQTLTLAPISFALYEA
ncbi:malto-oligosyltrehalose trehalohydrolase [Altericista sp. CCNU0014]|uniref:malto-oligosyltrehalose trehalohydrolase n=1 Tax=Altericista sp. CCNU0014 TaxID=3082949 RepID=UPI00384B6C2D